MKKNKFENFTQKKREKDLKIYQANNKKKRNRKIKKS